MGRSIVANGGRRSVAGVRKVVAAILGTVAVFVVLFGAGMGSWTIAALGLALLVLAIGLVAVNALRGGARAWVVGSAHVLSVSEPPANSTYGRCEMQIVVEAHGLPSAAVKVRDPRVPVAKWPDAGATLPILVAVDDPRHVRIQWDDVLTHAEAAAEEQLRSYEDSGHDLTEDLPGVDPMPPVDDVRDGGLITGVEETIDRDRRDAEPETLDLTGTLDLADDAEAVRREERSTDRPERPTGGDSGDGSRDPDERDRTERREPVIITHTSTGPVVEGHVVERTDEGGTAGTPEDARPPRRRPSPRPRRDPDARRRTATVAGAAATAAAAAATAATAGGSGPTRPTGRGPDRPSGEPEAHAEEDDQRAATTTATATDSAEERSVADVITAYPSARPGPAGAIRGVGITVLVTDLDRSVAFYRDLLGFFEIDGGEANAVLASGDTRVVLRAIPEVAPVNRRVVHVNLEVGDVDATYRELKEKGIRFTYGPRPVNRGEKLELWAAAFRDPDGHGIAITQWRSRPVS